MILDLNDVKKSGVNRKPHPEDLSSSTSFSSSASLGRSKDIIRKTIMTKTEITIYPNGQTYYKSNTWEVGKPMVVKKKVKKEAKMVETKKQKEEVY